MKYRVTLEGTLAAKSTEDQVTSGLEGAQPKVWDVSLDAVDNFTGIFTDPSDELGE